MSLLDYIRDTFTEKSEKHSDEEATEGAYAKSKQGEELVRAVREEKINMPYVSASSCNSIGAVVPTKLSFETFTALTHFFENKLDTAEFVREKLKYSSRLAVCEAFAAEQTDAIALAIIQIDMSKGFILGDQAGLGKGRVNAAILRYAHAQGKIPVFMTVSANLFSDMYRDIIDIGGFADMDSLPVPFILNGEGNEGDENIKDAEGNVLFPARDTKDIVKDCLKMKMPDGYDLIIMTYNQINSDMDRANLHANDKAKFDFLQSIAGDAIFVQDESHKGASQGNTGVNLAKLLSMTKGCLFSSATYAKTPEAMLLYIPKTDIAKSKINPSTIVDSVAENGEVIQEYIASLLVEGGEMIRRDRTFDGCKVNFDYAESTEKEKYFKLYDDVIILYNKIAAFSKTGLLKDAANKAVARFAKEYKITLLTPEELRAKPTNDTELAAWKAEHKDKYYYSYNNSNLVKNRFMWIENLLFAIKADYVADEAIKAMRTFEEVQFEESGIKSMKMTNYKPVIAIRNTAEAGLRQLGLKKGDVISKEKNDYAQTLVNIAESMTKGTLKFTKVMDVNNKHTVVLKDAAIEPDDFEDGATAYNAIVAEMHTAVSHLPLSPIDYMIEKIQSTKRSDLEAKYGFDYCGSENYVVKEVTKRSIGLRKADAAGEEYNVIDVSGEDVHSKTSEFNSGKADVIIVNTAGSTGLSIHSSIKFFDKRPRAMLIHQVELDVNTEVQKRGRVNRTGQVNKPSYVYIVSLIPSETRKLMMLRRKMRSLDANTTGNVSQNASASEIRDAAGNIVEDIYNKYGLEVLQELLNQADFLKYTILQKDAWWSKNASAEDNVNSFTRELETFTSAEQEFFYNSINVAYKTFVDQKKESGEYDLETTIEPLKAATLNKRLLYSGNEENVFTSSVYIEDKYVTPKSQPMKKEEVESRISELAGGTDYQTYHRNLNAEFEKYSKKTMKDLKDSFVEPDYTVAVNEEEKAKMVEEFENSKNEAIAKASVKLSYIDLVLTNFMPRKPVWIPIDTEALREGWQEASEGTGTPKYLAPDQMALGRFLGYKLLEKSDNRFTGMNITLEFAAINNVKPILRVSLTAQYENVVRWIMAKRVDRGDLKFIEDWNIKGVTGRAKMRIITGEVFKAFELANSLIKDNSNYERSKRLIKYSTASGGQEAGVRMRLKSFIPLTNETQVSYVPINSTEFIESIKQKSWGETFIMPSLVEYLEVADEGEKYRFYISSRNKPKKMFSEFANPESIVKLGKAVGVDPVATKKSYYSEMMQAKVKNADVYEIELDNKKLVKLLDYLYIVKGTVATIDGGTWINKNVGDTIKDGSKPTSAEGIYEYYPLARFDVSDAPANFINIVDVPQNTYGKASFKFPLTPVEAWSYNLVPANISKAQAIENVMVMLRDDRRRDEYIKKVKDLKDKFYQIGQLTQDETNIGIEFMFGNTTLPKAGEVMSEYAHNPAKPKPQEVVEAATAEEQATNAAVSQGVDIETAQDFLIKLNA